MQTVYSERECNRGIQAVFAHKPTRQGLELKAWGNEKQAASHAREFTNLAHGDILNPTKVTCKEYSSCDFFSYLVPIIYIASLIFTYKAVFSLIR